MAKQEAERSNRFSISFLKKHGYLNKNSSYRSGTITWTYGYSENKSSIGFSVIREHWNTAQEKAYVRLQYSHTPNHSDQKENMDYNVELTTTPTNLGNGKRHWFICPLSKDGQYCGKRVGVLYCLGKWFGCRRCGEIAYASQMRGGKWRGTSVTYPDIDKLEAEIKRCYYRGKPTRKYQRLTKMRDKLDSDMVRLVAHLDKDFARKFARFKN